MDDWAVLEAELAAWRAAGRTPAFWWRDDDAGEPNEALSRLLELSEGHDLPLALAVVPADCGHPLAERLAGRGRITVLPHGLAHIDHAPAGEKKAEFGDHRPLFDLLADVATGWNRARLLFPEQILPVFVPPWNRLAPGLVPRLAAAGLRGLSRFGPRAAVLSAPGVVECNCHLDLVDWRGERGFVGEARALAALVAHLSGRREGRHDADEPTGVMSHHLAHDEACWNFLERLFTALREGGSARWLSAAEAFNLRQ